MRWGRYLAPGSGSPRLGILVSRGQGDVVMDMQLAVEALTGASPQDSESILAAVAGADGKAIATLSEEWHRQLVEAASSLDPDASQVVASSWVLDEVTFLPPIANPGKIVCAGLNYSSHVEETGMGGAKSGDLAEVVGFSKFPSTLVGHLAEVAFPAGGEALDYEGELCLVIGEALSGDIPAEAARAAITGYTIMNDLSLRDVQESEMARGLLLAGKNFPGSAPTGPWVVSADELSEPENLRLETRVNGDIRQSGNTSQMLTGLVGLVQFAARMGLEAGDLIATGTPAGVAFFRPDPENYLLRPGDIVDVSIEGIGTLSNRIVKRRIASAGAS